MQEGSPLTPEFVLGCFLILAGTAAVVFPRPKTYLVRIINLELPAWGLLLLMLAYNETLALLTFGGVSALTVYILVRVLQKTEES